MHIFVDSCFNSSSQSLSALFSEIYTTVKKAKTTQNSNRTMCLDFVDSGFNTLSQSEALTRLLLIPTRIGEKA